MENIFSRKSKEKNVSEEKVDDVVTFEPLTKSTKKKSETIVENNGGEVGVPKENAEKAGSKKVSIKLSENATKQSTVSEVSTSTKKQKTKPESSVEDVREKGRNDLLRALQSACEATQRELEAYEKAKRAKKAKQEFNAYLPIYNVINDLDGTTYGKMVRCRLDKNNKIVEFDSEIIDFEVKSNSIVIGYVFTDENLQKLVGERTLNLKMANLNNFLNQFNNNADFSQSCGLETYNKVREQFNAVGRDYLMREIKNLSYEQVKEFNSEFKEIISSADEEVLNKINKMKSKYRMINENPQANIKANNVVPLFCVMEDDYSLSTVCIHCVYKQNGDVAFNHKLEIVKGFDATNLGNVFEDVSLENKLAENNIVKKLENLHTAFNYLSERRKVVEERSRKAGNSATDKAEGEEELVISEWRENGKKKEDKDISVVVGSKIYGAMCETRKAFYFIAKRYLEKDSTFIKETDNLNANLIVAQLSQFPMHEVEKNILNMRDRIDFVVDDANGVKYPRQKKHSICKNGGEQAVIDLSMFNKSDIKIV